MKMRNIMNYLYVILSFVNASFLNMPKNIERSNIYTYFKSDENIIICADKKYKEENLFFKNIQNKKEFDCLVPVKENSYFDIDIHILKTSSSNNSQRLLNLKIGNNLIFNNVDLDSKKIESKRILIKINKNGSVYYSSKNPICIIHDDECNFTFLNETIFFGKFLKINFFLTRKVISNNLLQNDKKFRNSPLITSFTENRIVKKLYTNSCIPQCTNGVCFEGNCLCESGYIGVDCSVELKNSKKGIILLIFFLSIALFLGICWMCSIFYLCCNKLFMDDDKLNIPIHREISLNEEWKKEG